LHKIKKEKDEERNTTFGDGAQSNGFRILFQGRGLQP
jgi:hypothetical protein